MEVTPEYGLFREFDLEATLGRIRTVWDLAWPLPLPRQAIRSCPTCEAAGSIPRKWRCHARSSSPHPWRCDVYFKCTTCGLAWTHGLVVPEAMYEAHPDESFDRREALGVLEDAGWSR